MQTFKKVLLSIISFVCVFTVLCAIIIEPIIQKGMYYYCDNSFRDKTAGQYEMLFIGDSDGISAFKPDTFEKRTGIKAYNLCGVKNTSQSELYMLKKEIERNPVKDVVIQIEFETFTRDYSTEYGEAESATAMRINNIFERLNFIRKNSSIDGYLDIFSKILTISALAWERNLTGDKSSNFDPDTKGWHRLDSNDIRIYQDEAKQTYNTESADEAFREDRMSEFNELISLCKSKNVNVIVLMVPVSDSYVWKIKNYNVVSKKVNEICINNNVKFLDFNLYKERYKYFTDVSDFNDAYHLSPQGADNFTNIFSQIYLSVQNGQEYKDIFYDNYDEMKQDSPYMEYVK